MRTTMTTGTYTHATPLGWTAFSVSGRGLERLGFAGSEPDARAWIAGRGGGV
jgi:hypothetical protein